MNARGNIQGKQKYLAAWIRFFANPLSACDGSPAISGTPEFQQCAKNIYFKNELAVCAISQSNVNLLLQEKGKFIAPRKFIMSGERGVETACLVEKNCLDIQELENFLYR